MIDVNVEYIKIEDNPIELLKSIKILLHEPEQSNYLCVTTTESFKRIVNMKQKENTSVLDYLKLLKQAKDILELHVGKYILGHYVDNPEAFKNTTGN